KTNGGQWLPRIGLAWQLNQKTVLRTGYGIYFGSLGVDSFVPVQTGFSQTTPIQASLDNGQTYVATLASPFPKGLIPPSGAAGGLTTSLGQGVSFRSEERRVGKEGRSRGWAAYGRKNKHETRICAYR